MDSDIISLNNKKYAFYKWKFKTEKIAFESKLKNYYNKKNYFRKWFKSRNKRKIVHDLINKKKNVLNNDIINQIYSINDLLIFKIMQYFFGRLQKIMINKEVCDMIDNAYINNYKKIFINRLSSTPKLYKGIIILDSLLKELDKKKAIKKIKNKIRAYYFNEKLKNLLYDKLKRKFIYKIKEIYNVNLNEEELDLIKNGKKLKRIIGKIFKKKAFKKIKNHYQLYKDIDKLNKGMTNLLKKRFMDKFKEKTENKNGFNIIQKIMDRKKCIYAINKLKNIANSPKGIKNQKRINAVKLNNILEKAIRNAIKSDVFNEMKRNDKLINGSNKLKKVMHNRYKKRLLYLLRLTYIYNKPKTSKIKSRYPAHNMTRLSAKIDQLLLTKIKKRFINELKNISNIDKSLFYMIMAIKYRIKKEVFDILKTICFVDKLDRIINNNKKRYQKQLLDKLKLNDDYFNNIKKNYFNKWYTLTNKNNILNALKNKLKKKKYFNEWRKRSDLNYIKDILVYMKRIVDKENADLLKQYLFKLNDKAIRRKILNELRKKLKMKNINKILNDKKKNILRKYFDKLKKYKKIELPKNKRKNNYNKYQRRNINYFLPEKVNNTEYRPQIKQKQEFVIIRQNNISIDKDVKNIKNNNNIKNDMKQINKEIKPVNKERSIKKRKVRRVKGRSKEKIIIYTNNKKNDILQKAFEKWKNNVNKMKAKEDFQNIMNGLKQINDDKDKNDELLLKKLKKANVYLLLDIYKESRLALFKKYFNKWRNNANEIKNKKLNTNKNIKNKKLPNKYIRKKIDTHKNNKTKKIKDNDNKKIIQEKLDKTFMKKRTKENLYKSNPYDNAITERSIIRNENGNKEDDNDNYRKPPERNKKKLSNIKNGSFVTVNINNSKNIYRNNNISILEPDYHINDTVGEIPNKMFLNKSTERRRTNNTNNYIPFYLENEDIDAYMNEYNGMDIYNNFQNRMNEFDKTFSSKNYDTNDHFTLIEESNEIRKPAEYVNESFNKDKDNRNKIKDVLLTSFDTLNNNGFLGNSLTERKDSDNRTKKSSINTNMSSRSQKNRKKTKNFTISIPLNGQEELENSYINNYYLKKTPEKKYNRKSNDEKTNVKTNIYSNNQFNINFSTPSNDYCVNWENGNSTCSRIIKNEANLDLNSYNTSNKRRYKKRAVHNKCKSGVDISENEDSNYNGVNRYDNSRKQLFY